MMASAHAPAGPTASACASHSPSLNWTRLSWTKLDLDRRERVTAHLRVDVAARQVVHAHHIVALHAPTTRPLVRRRPRPRRGPATQQHQTVGEASRMGNTGAGWQSASSVGLVPSAV